jgi:hypothetical protein
MWIFACFILLGRILSVAPSKRVLILEVINLYGRAFAGIFVRENINKEAVIGHQTRTGTPPRPALRTRARCGTRGAAMAPALQSVLAKKNELSNLHGSGVETFHQGGD